MSVMFQCHSVIIDCGISSPVNYKEVVHGLNYFDKLYIYQLPFNIQLLVSKLFESHIVMHSCTQNNDVIMAIYYQKYISRDHRKYRFIDQVKYRKRSSK